MKVSIGAKIKDGPWGGGNLFVINLSKYLEKKGHKVIYDLKDDDIDIVLLTDPRKKSESSTYTHKEIKKYLKKVNPKAKVVHRINECDERKNTKGLNKFYINANKIADHTVFVSTWLSRLYKEAGHQSANSSIIMSGSDPDIFYPQNKDDPSDKIKFVTHHWGANWNKGFDTYEKLDSMLSTENWKSRISFTYIGNLPKKFHFRNTNYISPMSGVELATELRNHDAYITGSLNEPSGNHHIEAAQCGLPLLYIESGALPEYCEGYGLGYKIGNFEEKVGKFLNEYDLHKKKVLDYPHSSDKMCKEYLNVFIKLMN